MNKQNKKRGLSTKNEEWFLKKYEDKFINFALPLVPPFIETYHLTYFTFFWSILTLFFGFMARNNILWLWGTSIVIILQHLTDMLDGAVGRSRNTGLVIWGFFMDHFLDFIFAYSLITVYAMIAPISLLPYLFGLCAVVGALLHLGVVSAALTKKVTISVYGFGTSEFRWIIILFNLLLMYVNPGLVTIIPYVLGLLIIVTIVKLRSVHKELWALDMKNKENKKDNS